MKRLKLVLLSCAIIYPCTSITITSLILASSSVVFAGYNPPHGQRPPTTRTTTTGSRGGCETNGEASLKVLAPQKHVGQTASTHPTLAWFVPGSKPLPMEFRLYQYNAQGKPQLQRQFQLQSKYGIMTLALPKNQPGLEVGKRYLWQVAILCDPRQPANDLVAMAEIDVIKMPAQVRFVRNVHTNIDRLAEVGLWYDALAEALKTGQKDAVLQLINNLATLETPKAARPQQDRTYTFLILANKEISRLNAMATPAKGIAHFFWGNFLPDIVLLLYDTTH